MQASSDTQILISEFKRLALALKTMAEVLDYGNFAKMMENTVGALDDERLDDKQKLLKAYDCSRIFGGMGSWLDCPPFTAEHAQLSQDYDKITGAFYDIRKKALHHAQSL